MDSLQLPINNPWKKPQKHCMVWKKIREEEKKIMDIILIPLLAVISAALGIYAWIVIASVIMSWLVNFNVINSTNNFVLMLMEFLFKVTEPVLVRIRRFVPIVSGFDLSPIVLILLIWFLQAVIGRIMGKILMVTGV